MKSFGQTLTLFAKATPARIETVRRSVTLKLFAAIVGDTPVDTGRLRGNWVLTKRAPDLQEKDTEDKAGSVTVQLAQVALVDTVLEDIVFFANNVPYAYRIEFDGWSHTKAPDGMVRKNVIRFTELMREEARKR